MSPRALAVRLIGLVLLVVSAAACGAGSPSSPASSTAPLPASQDIRDSPAAPMPTPVPAGPPVATLSGLGGAGAAGALGTFSWDGLVSDAPWIVGERAGQTRAGTVLAIGFPPVAGEVTWQARWAPITGGQPGIPVDAGSGSGVPIEGPIEVIAPPTPGAWGLQLVARFGSGRSATWYWRVEVVA